MLNEFFKENKSGIVKPKTAFPITFGKRWDAQPTITQLWFYGLALYMRKDCYAIHCRFSHEDLKKLRSYKGGHKKWFSNKFNKHLKGASRALVLEDSKYQPATETTREESDLHVHGVVSIAGLGLTQDNLTEALKKIFMGSSKKKGKEASFFKHTKAIVVKPCDLKVKHTTAKTTIVGGAMGSLLYASKHTDKTKASLAKSVEEDLPVLFDRSKMRNYFNTDKKKNKAFYRSICSISANGLGKKAAELYDKLYEDGHLRNAYNENTTDVRKLMKGFPDLTPEQAEAIKQSGVDGVSLKNKQADVIQKLDLKSAKIEIDFDLSLVLRTMHWKHMADPLKVFLMSWALQFMPRLTKQIEITLPDSYLDKCKATGIPAEQYFNEVIQTAIGKSSSYVGIIHYSYDPALGTNSLRINLNVSVNPALDDNTLTEYLSRKLGHSSALLRATTSKVIIKIRNISPTYELRGCSYGFEITGEEAFLLEGGCSAEKTIKWLHEKTGLKPKTGLTKLDIREKNGLIETAQKETRPKKPGKAHKLERYDLSGLVLQSENMDDEGEHLWKSCQTEFIHKYWQKLYMPN